MNGRMFLGLCFRVVCRLVPVSGCRKLAMTGHRRRTRQLVVLQLHSAQAEWSGTEEGSRLRYPSDACVNELPSCETTC